MLAHTKARVQAAAPDFGNLEAYEQTISLARSTTRTFWSLTFLSLASGSCKLPQKTTPVSAKESQLSFSMTR